MATRENAPEVSGETLSAIFGDQNSVFIKRVNAFDVPVRPAIKEGDTVTAEIAKGYNTYRLERSAATANSNITRGSWKDLTDDEKREKLVKYLAETNPSEDAGSMWNYSLLHQAMHNILMRLPKNAEKLASRTPSEQREALAKLVQRALNDPAATERYREAVSTEMGAILSAKHEIRKRGTGAAAEGEDEDLAY